MFSYLKNVLIQIRNRRNSISLTSDISLNTVIGSGNCIKNSLIYNSIIHSNCFLNDSRIFSTTVNDNTKITGAKIYSGNIGSNVNIGENTLLSASTISKYTYLAGNNRLFNTTIGAFCSIAENVSIGHAEHPYTILSSSPVFYKKDNPFETTKFFTQEVEEFKETNIGNDVWIGFNSYIKTGVNIGNGAIIGAGAIVTKDIDPYCIVAGVPARPVKKRFDDQTIAELQNYCWWDKSDEAIIDFAISFNKNRS